MAEIIDGSVMAEAVGVTSAGYLGGADTLHSLNVVVYPAEQRAVVWAGLRDTSLDAQLNAVAAFVDVRECYSDELEVELRFGEPDEPASDRATAKAMQLTR
ncbi:hypothetical protein [Microbacterium sp.]|uniref:hypothetical protein n=1 Tax=Microbacterium sp. TaxID=51671 RepID=UPI0035624B63